MIKNNNKKYKKLIPVGKVILFVVAGVALMSLTSIMPGVVYALQKFGVGKKLLKRQQYYINDSLERLIKKGFIDEVTKNGSKHFRVTPLGRKALARFEFENLSKQKPKKWDGKYRVVIFDVKENIRFSRDDLRYMLLKFGFVRLQNSVWVYPYPCRGAVDLLKTHLEIRDEVVYMTVESIEDDEWLRKKFDLSKK